MSARVAICDYGIGNLRSVERAVLAAGAEAKLTHRVADIDACDGLVLPGVGAFGAALDALHDSGLHDAVVRVAASGRPLLGVCVGFQLLFEWSDESGGREGLGLLAGRVERLDASRGKVPHMGWNTLVMRRPSRLFSGLTDGTAMYFVHSYAARVPDEDVVAVCDYGGEVVAACERGSVLGTQFHPEKSGRDGLRVYANFAHLCSAGAPAA